MSNESAGNRRSTGAASPNRRPPITMYEAEYLRQQAADAKTAMAQTVRGIIRPLKRAASEHPLLAIGAAALAGALAARALRPSSHNGEREKKEEPRVSFLGGLFAD